MVQTRKFRVYSRNGMYGLMNLVPCKREPEAKHSRRNVRLVGGLWTLLLRGQWYPSLWMLNA